MLAPTLFSLLFAQMLSAALSQTEAGVKMKIHYRTDGDCFNMNYLDYNSHDRKILNDGDLKKFCSSIDCLRYR